MAGGIVVGTSLMPAVDAVTREEFAEDAGVVRVMFNNNRGADAPHAAARFREPSGAAPRGQQTLP